MWLPKRPISCDTTQETMNIWKGKKHVPKLISGPFPVEVTKSVEM